MRIARERRRAAGPQSLEPHSPLAHADHNGGDPVVGGATSELSWSPTLYSPSAHGAEYAKELTTAGADSQVPRSLAYNSIIATCGNTMRGGDDCREAEPQPSAPGSAADESDDLEQCCGLRECDGRRAAEPQPLHPGSAAEILDAHPVATKAEGRAAEPQHSLPGSAADEGDDLVRCCGVREGDGQRAAGTLGITSRGVEPTDAEGLPSLASPPAAPRAARAAAPEDDGAAAEFFHCLRKQKGGRQGPSLLYLAVLPMGTTILYSAVDCEKAMGSGPRGPSLRTLAPRRRSSKLILPRARLSANILALNPPTKRRTEGIRLR